MAKYDPLRTFLRRQKTDAVELSFREIENLMGVMLPKGAGKPEWWSNTHETGTARTLQSRAWLEAGFHARLLKADDRVAFARTAASGLGRD